MLKVNSMLHRSLVSTAVLKDSWFWFPVTLLSTGLYIGNKWRVFGCDFFFHNFAQFSRKSVCHIFLTYIVCSGLPHDQFASLLHDAAGVSLQQLNIHLQAFLCPQQCTITMFQCFWCVTRRMSQNWTETLYETVLWPCNIPQYNITSAVPPILQDTHCIYQTVGSFAVYLLTLSAKVCLNGNSGNKQYLGGESVHVHVGLLSWIN